MRAAKWMMAGSALAVALVGGAARADVVISKKATANMSCSAGVCSPTAAKAVLNATDLANMLAGGDVKVTTGAGATNIVVKDSFSWTATSRLTLDAIQSVEFDKTQIRATREGGKVAAAAIATPESRGLQRKSYSPGYQRDSIRASGARRKPSTAGFRT